MQSNMRFEAVRWLGATVAAACMTAILVALHVGSTTSGLIFLVLVVWTATQVGRAAAIYSAVLCALFFNYFFLLPLHTFRLEGADEWIAFLSFLASSGAAGRMAERARNQTRKAEQRREEMERLYMLGQEMMLFDDAIALMSELPRIIGRIFALDPVVLYSQDLDACYASTGDIPMGLRASLSSVSLGHSLLQDLSAEPGPGEFAAMPLTVGMRSVGALGWRPANLSREVATALTAQVAIALERAVAIERSARLEASREGERLRAALIDSVTHELRTPLTSIRAAVTTLRETEGLEDAVRNELVSILDEESAQLDALIGEAVEMAELDANSVHVHLEPCDARTLLEHAVAKSHSVLVRHRVVIQVEEPNEEVLVDPQLLGRVLRHLLENAARYCPTGSRIALRSLRNGDRLELSVEDNGPGIDPVDLPLIFEKFYRGKKSTGKGTGMGLAITRAILSAHGGGIDVESSPQHGTKFRFWVPLVRNDATRAPGIGKEV